MIKHSTKRIYLSFSLCLRLNTMGGCMIIRQMYVRSAGK